MRRAMPEEHEGNGEEVGGDEWETARNVHERICARLEDSYALEVEEAWLGQMEVVAEQLATAEDEVFEHLAQFHDRPTEGQAVHFAAAFGSRTVLEVACRRTGGSLANGAQVKNGEGCAALHFAVQNKRLSASDMRWVVSLHPAAASIAKSDGEFPLHLLLRWHQLLSVELVNALVEAHPAATQTNSWGGQLSLHIACRNPHVDAAALRHIMFLHPAAVTTVDKEDNLPLHHLVQREQLLSIELVDVVVESFPAALQIAGWGGQLPLHVACCNPHITAAVLRHLVSLHPSAAMVTVHRNLPLHHLVRWHQLLSVELVDAVLQVHPVGVKMTGWGGRLPLHLACDNAHSDAAVLRHLVSLHQEAASIADADGNLPLHYLVRCARLLSVKMVDAVLDAHPAAVQTAGQGGQLPLHLACLNPHVDAAVLRHLVSLHPTAASTADDDGRLPLHLLLAGGDEAEERLLNVEKVDAVLDAHPAAVQTAGQGGQLPLHLACLNPLVDAAVLRHLVSLHPSAACTTDERGNLPLHVLVVARTLSAGLVSAVVEAYPEALHIANQTGALPLHLACSNSRVCATPLEVLLRASPEAVCSTDAIGRTPYDCLIRNPGIANNVRVRLASLLMDTTDTLYPFCAGLFTGSNHRQSGCSSEPALAASLAQTTASTRYTLPPPDPAWVAHRHPLSVQGRLRVGVRVAIRGSQNAWQFQTGGVPAADLSRSAIVRAGHKSLLIQQCGQIADQNVSANDVLQALTHGHDGVVRELLVSGWTGARRTLSPSTMRTWLTALMRQPALDHQWLVQWIQNHRGVWDGEVVPMDWLCLEAAARSGRLSLVESVADMLPSRHCSHIVRRKQLAVHAVVSGSVAVLRWLEDAGLARFPSSRELRSAAERLAEHDQLEMVEFLHSHSLSSEVGRRQVVVAAVEHGSMRVLRWLHVHTCLPMDMTDMEKAMSHGQFEVVHFLHRHRNVTTVSAGALASAVRRSCPDTLAIVEYVIQNDLCRNGTSSRVLVSACTATNLRMRVVRYLVSRASEDVARAVEEQLPEHAAGAAVLRGVVSSF